MRHWAPLTCLAVAAATVSLPALAQPRAPSTTADTAAAQTDEQRKAQEHFQRAKELYSTGKYSEAIAELEVARELDPKAKDLVMNPKNLLTIGAELREVYSNSLMLREDDGHRFGEDLPDKDKQALIAFLATL